MMMKLSDLAAKAEELRSIHGDIDVLDPECFPVCDVTVRYASEGELKYWGMDPKVPFLFAQIQPVQPEQ